jgi:hypothetical protein
VYSKKNRNLLLKNKQIPELAFNLTVYNKVGISEFWIFRKPADSCHPPQHKLAGIRFLVSRHVKYPLDTKYKEEANLTQNIVYNDFGNNVLSTTFKKIDKKYKMKNEVEEITKQERNKKIYSKFCYNATYAFLWDIVFGKSRNKNRVRSEKFRPSFNLICLHGSLKSRNSQDAYAKVGVMQPAFTYSSIALQSIRFKETRNSKTERTRQLQTWVLEQNNDKMFINTNVNMHHEQCYRKTGTKIR